MTTALDIVTNALAEVGGGVYAPGEAVSAADTAFCLSKLNRLLDAWATRRLYVYAMTFGTPLTLIPNLQPHTIGPAGGIPAPTYVMAQRPVKIERANIILNNATPATRVPLNVHQGPVGAEWWANQRVQGITSTIPSDLYYSPDWPNGSLYLWPVPTTAYQLELETWTLAGNPWLLTDSFSMPPGYEDAITLSLAESLLVPFEAQPNPLLMQAAAKARAAIGSLNSEAPLMGTRDAGVPSGRGTRSYFNWLTGTVVNH